MLIILLSVGICIIACGVILAFLKRDIVTIALLLITGIVICIWGLPGVKSLDLSFLGVGAKVTKQVTEDQTAVVDALAPIQLSIQKLQDALANQEKFNKTITTSLNKLGANSAGEHQAIEQPNISSTSPAFAANNQYSVFVFFRSSRTTDSQALVRGLTAAGFQASAISTTFEEAPPIGPDGSTWIVPTDRGNKIAKEVESIATKLNLPNVNLGGAYPLSRGDVQVFLY